MGISEYRIRTQKDTVGYPSGRRIGVLDGSWLLELATKISNVTSFENENKHQVRYWPRFRVANHPSTHHAHS